MTVQDVAEREGISERQAQRYITEGFQGHKLPAVKVGKAWSITDADYAAFRQACGWETQPEPIIPQVEVIAPQVAPQIVDPAPCAEHPDPEPPSMFRPATVDGPLTNCPHPASSNWAAPETCQAYLQREARKLVAKYRGDPYAEPID